MASGLQEPGETVLLRAFLNTVDVEGGVDEVAEPDALGRWLVGRGLLEAGTEVAAADHRLALRLRAGLRAALGADDPWARDGEVTAVAGRLPLTVALDEAGRPVLRPGADGVRGALGQVLAAATQIVQQGRWERLKVCRRHTCQWVFYDGSKNSSRTWCAMSVCGNREKTKAYRARHRDHRADRSGHLPAQSAADAAR